jgi:TolB-like protein
VELKSGKIFENVKTKITKEAVQFISDGKQMAFEKKLIKNIRLRSIISKPPVTAKEKLEVEAERVRVAETLQTETDWEMEPEARPVVAVVLFRAGKGVSLAEAESVTNLIQTGLVKSKLFNVVDVSSLSKTCTDDEIDCAKKIRAKRNINKIVTGSITKLGNKYLLNGYVVNDTNNSIDFAEKSSANTILELENTSEYFSKKIAGGIMEFWEEAMTAKELEAFKNVKYVWRSAIFPGLGQWKYGDDEKENFSKYKAYAFGGITLGLIGNLLSKESTKIESRNQYTISYNLFFLLSSGNNTEILGFINQANKFNNYETATENTKLAAGMLIGFYFINLFDSFFQGRYYLPTRNTKQTNLFFYPTKSLSSGTKEDIYSIGVNYQF